MIPFKTYNFCFFSGDETLVHDHLSMSIYSRSCFARNCGSTNAEKGNRFFGFPKDEECRRIWIYNLKVDPGKIRQNMYACQCHFDAKSLSSKILPKGTLPICIQEGISFFVIFYIFYNVQSS